MSNQTETLLVMNAKLDSLVTADKTPEKDALQLRKQAAARQRAALVEQMRALKVEEDNISSFDEGSNFMVPGKPRRTRGQARSIRPMLSIGLTLFFKMLQ